MADLVFPDTLFDLRYWLRHHPNFADLCPGRTFFRLPNEPAPAPFMRLYQSGGGPDLYGETPVDAPRLSVEMWGSDNSQYPILRQIQLGLQDACHHIESPTLINPTGNTILLAANLNTAVDIPDPDTGWPRKVCDMSVVATAATPTVV